MAFTILQSDCVVSLDGCQRNFDLSVGNHPHCVPQPERKDKLAIVGSGPSVQDYLDEIRNWDGEIWAVNGAYDYLQGHGIVAHGVLGVDPLPGLAEYYKNARKETTFYISGLCDPATFEMLDGQNVKIWFPVSDVKYPAGLWCVPGGTSALTRAPWLAHMLGFRDVTYYGADSSFRDDRYCYKSGTYAEDSGTPTASVDNPAMKVSIGGKVFLTELPLVKQVAQFSVIIPLVKLKFTFRCDGLLKAFLDSPMGEMPTDIKFPDAA